MTNTGYIPDDIDVSIAEIERDLALIEKYHKQQSSDNSQWYSPHYNHVRNLLADRPHKQLEQMCRSKRVHIINTNARAFGVLANTLLYFRNELFRDQTYVVSITQSRSLAEEQQLMFEAESEVLNEWECQAKLLFNKENKGSKKEKRHLKHIHIPKKTFLVTSPYFLLDLLIDPYWKRNYGVPAIILLTDIDAYPPKMFQAIIPLIHLLLWENPQIQIIINSETLGNSSQIARIFFGGDTSVIQIQGVIIRGSIEFRCDKEFDSNSKNLRGRLTRLILYLNELKEKAQSGLLNPMYLHKEILYIRDQWILDWLLTEEYLSDAFVVIHENLSSEEIIKQLELFRVEPQKTCLVTTDIIEGDYYLPHIKRGFFYGLPPNPQTYLRIRNHICRETHLRGKIEVVLRETNSLEKEMCKQEKNKQFPQLEHYIGQEDLLPILYPYFTPQSLQFWVGLGYYKGISDILTRIQQELQECNEGVSNSELWRIYKTLFKKELLNKTSSKKFKPTKKLKPWLYRTLDGFFSNG